MEPVTAGLITAGLSAASQGANAFAQGKMNKKTMAYNREMYEKQKNDNLEFWNMQNSYNSPQAQMARLQEAGLNPNLVYGNGTVANSSSSVQTPHAMPYRPQAPEFNAAQVLDGYFNVQMKQQTVDNMKQQGDNLAMEGLLKFEDYKSKEAFNNFMQKHGYYQKETSGYLNIAELQEKMFKDKVLNQVLFGRSFNADEPSYLKKDSSWNYQLQGSKLLNDLRAQELKNKGLDYDRKKFDLSRERRLNSGDFKNFGMKDYLDYIKSFFSPVRVN